MSTVSASTVPSATPAASKPAAAGNPALPHGAELFSDAGMRPYLEAYFNAKMAPLRDRIVEMEAAEARGEDRRTVALPDGGVATELSAAQYRAAMVEFDDWLALNADPDSPLQRSPLDVEQAEAHLRRLMESGPDSPVEVSVVFWSPEAGILGHVGDGGGVASHAGAGALRWIADQADELNLTGQDRIDYIKREGAAILRQIHGDLEVTDYRTGERPSRRAYMERWYPGVDVDRDHADRLREAREQLEQGRSLERNRLGNRDELIDFITRMMAAAPSEA